MVLFPRTCAFPRLPLPAARHYAPRANAATPPPLHEHPVAGLPRRWVVFSDLHVRQDTLPVCLQLLRTVADEARARAAGVICLGDFWHAGGVLSTRQLNAVLSELHAWGDDVPMLMIPGNHDQAMRGNPDPQLHALTPLALALPHRVHVFSQPTLLGGSLWVPYGALTADGMRAACAEAQACEGGLDAVFCHADVVGGLMNDGTAAALGLPADAFPPSPVRVYSGHYHKPHHVAEPAARGRTIRYVGSSYQTSMAEAGQAKALLVLDREDGWRVEDEVALDLGRRHYVHRGRAGQLGAPELAALGASLRRGDRALLVAEDATDARLVAFAAAQRRRGAAVELRQDAEARGALPPLRWDSESEAAAAAAAAAAGGSGGGGGGGGGGVEGAEEGEGGVAAMRGGGGPVDLQLPASLLETYAEARNLSRPLVDEALALLEECASQAELSPPTPTHLQLDSVSVEGFGSFLDRVEYPLAQRGLTLLQGATVDALGQGGSAAAAVDGGAGAEEAGVAGVAGLGGAGRGVGVGVGVGGAPEVEVGAVGSNGAGKTTLAMAPFWALTGSSDARAEGRPVAARGVIHDRADAAEVRLVGRVRIGDREGADAAAAAARQEATDAGLEPAAIEAACDAARAAASLRPFELVRRIGRREHTLRFSLGGEEYGGTLAQVQAQLDEVLRARQLARVSFFGQHMGGGLLDKTDATLKAELQALLPLPTPPLRCLCPSLQVLMPLLPPLALQALLPLELWEAARTRAKERASALRDEQAAASGELAATERQRAQCESEAEALRAEGKAWEGERRRRADAQEAEAAAAAAAAATRVAAAAAAGDGDAAVVAGGGGVGGGAGGEGAGAGEARGGGGAAASSISAEAVEAALRAALQRAATAEAALAADRERERAAAAQAEAARAAALAAAQAASKVAAAAAQAAEGASGAVAVAEERMAAARAAVEGWGWEAARREAAEAAAERDDKLLRTSLRRAARAVGSSAEGGVVEGGNGRGGGGGGDPEGGPEGGDAGGDASGDAGRVRNLSELMAALEAAERQARARALAARQRAEEAMPLVVATAAATATGTTATAAANGAAAATIVVNGVANGAANGVAANGVAANGVAANGVVANGVAANGVVANGVGGAGDAHEQHHEHEHEHVPTAEEGEGGGVCAACGQPVGAEHARRRRDEARDAASAAEAAHGEAAARWRDARAAGDGLRVRDVRGKLRRLEAAAAEAARGATAARREAAAREGDAGAAAAALRAADEAGQAAARAAAARRAALEEAQRAGAAEARALEETRLAIAREAAATAAAAAQRREAAAQRRSIVAQPNPHAPRLRDALRRRRAAAARCAALADVADGAAARHATLVELGEHLGKRGVQNYLYELALQQLQSAAQGYAAELTGGRLQLRLAFDEQQKSIRKVVLARSGADGSGPVVERQVSQLSGGEWRRLGLALSLAFADFSSGRLGVSCSLLVLDEAMQHMDAEGQAAMARVLAQLRARDAERAETVLVITHGLQSDELYGAFDAVDTVEKAGDASTVRVGDELML